jgi:hypothetical protein
VTPSKKRKRTEGAISPQKTNFESVNPESETVQTESSDEEASINQIEPKNPKKTKNSEQSNSEDQTSVPNTKLRILQNKYKTYKAQLQSLQSTDLGDWIDREEKLIRSESISENFDGEADPKFIFEVTRLHGMKNEFEKSIHEHEEAISGVQKKIGLLRQELVEKYSPSSRKNRSLLSSFPLLPSPKWHQSMTFSFPLC